KAAEPMKTEPKTVSPSAKFPAAALSSKDDVSESLFPTPSEDAALTRQKDAAPKDRVAALDVIRQEVAGCMRCNELCTTRTNTVFGVGTPQPRLVFLGEAPGADEDAQGEPFVGRAGQLLTK